MDDEVGITADGRGEMRVVALGQAVMADVRGRIDGELQGPQDLPADKFLAGEALGLLEHALEVFRPDLGRFRQGQAEMEDEVPQFFEVADVRLGVDPVDGRDIFLRKRPWPRRRWP